MASSEPRQAEDWPQWALRVAQVSSTVRHARKVIEAGMEQLPALLKQAQLIEEMREVAQDWRYSNEFVGNVFRSKLAELDRG